MAKKEKKVQTVNNLLAGVERLFLQVMIGLVSPVLGLLIGWWGSVPFVAEDSIKYFALGGLMIGIFADLIFLRRWVRKSYDLPVTWFILVYLFYSICLFGFFMGVPVFNLFLGIIGGYYAGICLRHMNKNKIEVDKAAKRTALFTAAVMAALSILSLSVAYLDDSLVANIQGLFHMENAIGNPTILAISVIGGFVLVAAEYVFTRAAVKFARFM